MGCNRTRLAGRAAAGSALDERAADLKEMAARRTGVSVHVEAPPYCCDLWPWLTDSDREQLQHAKGPRYNGTWIQKDTQSTHVP